MAKQTLTGGNGTSGQTGQQARDMINDNFTELYDANVGVWRNMGTWDASGDTYPATGGSGTAGAILNGNAFKCSVASTTDGLFTLGCTVLALTDTPGQTSSNWTIFY
jgi:hypothetical protein